MILAGYAAPFGQIAYVEDQEFPECFARKAFEKVLVSSDPIYLNCFCHDYPAISRAVELWSDAYGLAFRAEIDDARWSGISNYVMSSNGIGVSVFMPSRITRNRTPDRGTSVSEIVEASLGHICLTDNPAYRGTGAWPLAAHGRMPAHLEKLSSLWRTGREQVLVARTRTRGMARERDRVATISKALGSGGCAMFLDGRPINPAAKMIDLRRQ